ncbi:hypothetical protein [Modestobacter sp. DSM 44400]|uniref:hypothetical protein n=1 Tax=Modestobacter sp. DSM 44400 TaxID=1550230 RepID=UPI0020C854DF
MQGEDLESVHVGPRGLAGDRCWGVYTETAASAAARPPGASAGSTDYWPTSPPATAARSPWSPARTASRIAPATQRRTSR